VTRIEFREKHILDFRESTFSRIFKEEEVLKKKVLKRIKKNKEVIQVLDT